MIRTAKEGMMQNATSSEVYDKMQDAFIKMDLGGDVSAHPLLHTYYITNGLFFSLHD
jgi:hypothetical protein